MDSTLIEYTTDLYDKRLDDLDAITMDEVKSGWYRLCEYSLAAVAEVLPIADYTHFTTQLTSPNMLVVGLAYTQLQQWCQKHVEDHPHLPMLRFIAATPPDLGYIVGILKEYHKAAPGKYNGGSPEYWSQAEADKIRQLIQQIPPPYQQTVQDGLAVEVGSAKSRAEVISDSATAALLLANGKIPAVSAKLRRYTAHCGNRVSHKSESYRASVASLMPLMEAAIAVRGQRWQAEAPQHLRVLTKDYTELQWIMANPVLGDAVVTEQRYPGSSHQRAG